MKTFLSAGRTPSSGISMDVFELPPGALLDPHHHHPQEACYVIDGEAEVFADGAWKPLHRGDVVYFPADAVHGARSDGAATCTIVCVLPADPYDAIECFSD